MQLGLFFIINFPHVICLLDIKNLRRPSVGHKRQDQLNLHRSADGFLNRHLR